MMKFFKKRIIGSNKGISIILAIIIIIMLGLAGSIFAYLIASGSITSRSNLLSAEAKYAAKSGVEITLWELENKLPLSTFFSSSQLPGCPTAPVPPPKVNGTLSGTSYYLSGNLQGNLPQSVEYTPTFCAVEGNLTVGVGGGGGGCYIITSNGFAGGTQREITSEACKTKGKWIIFVESELPNSN